MKTFNLGLFKVFFFGCAILSLTVSAQAVDLGSSPILPPIETSIIAQGMGNAVAADGTLFNATAFNPALMGRVPDTLELLNLGLSASNDIIGLANYLQHGNISEMSNVFQDITSSDSTQVTKGLQAIDDASTNLTNKAIQLGVGTNISVKVTNNFGFQVFNNSHAVIQALPGSLITKLTAIPLPYNAVNSPLLGPVTTAIASNLQTTLDSTLTSAQQSSISTQITALKNGTESPSDFVADPAVESVLIAANVDENLLKSKLLSSIIKNLVRINALVYSDFVAMGTIAFDPFEDFPLTVGVNGKVVRRYYTWSAVTDPTLINDLINGNSSSILTNLETATQRWGVDVGVLYAFEQDLSLGVSFEDLFKQSATIPITDPANFLYGVTTDPAPTVTRVGLSWHPIHEFIINADMDDVFSDTSFYNGCDIWSHFKFGSALTLAGIWQFRVGFSNNNFNGGSGIQLGFFGFDYSYAADELTHSLNHYGQFKFVF